MSSPFPLSTALIQISVCIGLCTHPDHDDPIWINGFIITPGPGLIVGGIGVAAIGSLVLSYCGHLGTIVTASQYCKSATLGRATITSQFVGYYSGYVVTGAHVSHITGV